MANRRGEKWMQWRIFFSWASKSLCVVTAAVKLKQNKQTNKKKKTCSLGGTHAKKQRHPFANKGPSSQSYGFSSSHVWMWELDYNEIWVPKNWCFWIVVLEKALESPLHSKIKPINPKGNQPWIFTGRIEAEAPILWPPDVKSRLFGKTLMLGEIPGKKRKGWQRMRWLYGVIDAMGISLSKLWEMVKDREA